MYNYSSEKKFQIDNWRGCNESFVFVSIEDITQYVHCRWSARYDQWWECKFLSEGIIDQGWCWLTNDKQPRIRLTVYAYIQRPTHYCYESLWPIVLRLSWPIRSVTRAGHKYTNWRYTNCLTLMMSSAQVVRTSVSVTNNSPLDDHSR